MICPIGETRRLRAPVRSEMGPPPDFAGPGPSRPAETDENLMSDPPRTPHLPIIDAGRTGGCVCDRCGSSGIATALSESRHVDASKIAIRYQLRRLGTLVRCRECGNEFLCQLATRVDSPAAVPLRPHVGPTNTGAESPTGSNAFSPRTGNE